MKKIVVIVNDYIEYVNIELFCFEVELFKVHLVERCLFSLSDNYSHSIKEELLVKLAEKDFLKAPCTVGIYSPFFFLESLTMPKLNFLEESKAVSLKLDKLYKNFDELFYSVHSKYISNKTVKHQVVSINKHMYHKLLDKFNDLSLNIDKVIFLPSALAEGIGKKHIFTKDKIGMFINLERNTSSIVITKGTSLIDYKVLDFGIMTLYEILTGKNDSEIEKLISSNNIQVTPSNLVKEFISKFTKEIKAMCFNTDNPIDEFYLYSEYGIDKNLKALFENALGVNLKTTVKLTLQPNVSLISQCILKSNSSSFLVKLNDKKK